MGEESGHWWALGQSLLMPSASVFLQTTGLAWKKTSKQTQVATWSGFWCASCRYHNPDSRTVAWRSISISHPGSNSYAMPLSEGWAMAKPSGLGAPAVPRLEGRVLTAEPMPLFPQLLCGPHARLCPAELTESTIPMK